MKSQNKGLAHKLGMGHHLNEQRESSVATIGTVYHCPKRPDTTLQNWLKGGAGFCKHCGLYVQAAGVPMPTPDAHVAAKRAATSIKPKQKGTGRV